MTISTILASLKDLTDVELDVLTDALEAEYQTRIDEAEGERAQLEYELREAMKNLA